ncbi:MAG: VWA domain-containing protein [Verrucomicrobiales bacterium]|nr:VWA domain-containing protein [Verrucomicrobiales bacterium]MCP5525206.1 VWA domain-containing protein [Verrucomicrobiales bacterium]
MAENIHLEDAIEFAENPEPRCPCVLVLDTSASMQGEAIEALNQGLVTFRENLIKDPMASRRVEVAVIAFDNEIRVVQDFITPDRFEPPRLTAQGQTFMGGAIQKALDLIQARKQQYRANGVAYYRPWAFLITDGEPQGEPESVVQSAAQRLKNDETAKRVAFFAVGVEGANMETLGTLVVRTPVKLHGLNFAEMFVWLSRSMEAIAQSRTDEQVALPPPGWASV